MAQHLLDLSAFRCPENPLSLSPTYPRSAADYLVAARQAEALSLQHLLRMARLVVAISSLVHALQRERGASGIFASSAGARFRELREKLVLETDRELANFDALLASLGSDGDIIQAGNRLLSRMALAVHQLEHLDNCRQRVAALQVNYEEVNQCYTELIRCLMAVVFEAADSASDPEITRALVALFHFMQGKELAGQERALGGMRLASGQFSTALAERAGILVEGQERCFEIFSHFADDATLALWRHDVVPCALEEVRRLRAIICSPCRDPQRDAELSEQWFAVCTRRIDAMKQVEDALERNVEQTSEIRLAAARQDLDRYRRDVLAIQQPDPLTTLADYPEDASVDALGPALGRSMIDLLQSQSQRLHSMQEQLDKARTALEERKLLDRAKALLMKHRRLREDEAHALLRKMAMNQGRKLIDVARAVIAMADVLGSSD
jgi:hypothetical protein